MSKQEIKVVFENHYSLHSVRSTVTKEKRKKV